MTASCGHACAPDDLTGGLCPSCAAALDATALAEQEPEDTGWADLPSTCSFCDHGPSRHFYDRYAACQRHEPSLAAFRRDDERDARRVRELRAVLDAVHTATDRAS